MSLLLGVHCVPDVCVGGEVAGRERVNEVNLVSPTYTQLPLLVLLIAAGVYSSQTNRQNEPVM